LKGDTIIQHENWLDTLFNISADNLLKKFKSYYFISNRENNNGWEVKKLWVKKVVLIVARISGQDKIQN
jgi:hypothetical protein